MLTPIQSPAHPHRTHFARALMTLAMLGVVLPAAAQQQSIEERLRTQLRATTAQLQQVQNELAALKGAKGAAAAPAPAAEVDALKRELSDARAQLTRERSARTQREGELSEARSTSQATVERANAQVAQFKGAYDELLKVARSTEAERLRLAAGAETHTQALAQCQAKNEQLYSLGQEILHAYETMDVSTVLAARQPFAAQSRVKFEQIAQQYGDQLYAGKFDARAIKEAAPADAPKAP
jgi:colicin import membrane protein